MGHSPEAKLIYGYDLGGNEDGWRFTEYDEDEGTITLPWMTDPVTEDIISDFEDRLRAEIAGFTETWAPGAGETGYFDRKKAADALVAVEFEFYGYEMCGHTLAAHTISVEWGCDPIDLAALTTRPATEGWDDKLAAAIRALGITPTQDRPGWLLAAMYG